MQESERIAALEAERDALRSRAMALEARVAKFAVWYAIYGDDEIHEHCRADYRKAWELAKSLGLL